VPTLPPPINEYIPSTSSEEGPGSVIEIPILPPKEYLPPVLQELPDRFSNYVSNATPIIRESFISNFAKVLTILVLLVLLALPLLKLLLLSIWYRYYLTAQLFREFLWLIGWRSEKYPQGIVVLRENQVHIPFALVLISGKSETGKNFNRTLIKCCWVFPIHH
jgi:hypothetical protein